MKSRPTLFFLRHVAAMAAALCVLMGLMFGFLRVGGGLAALSFDLPFFVRPEAEITNAVLVYMDDDSHRELGQPANSAWNRTNHARLLDRLAEWRAKAVIFDVHFDVPAPEDGLFLRSVAAATNAGTAVAIAGAYQALQGNLEGRTAVPPTEQLATDIPWGMVEFTTAGTVLRSHHEGETGLPSLAWIATSLTHTNVRPPP